jgi:hypothetical protein
MGFVPARHNLRITAGVGEKPDDIGQALRPDIIKCGSLHARFDFGSRSGVPGLSSAPLEQCPFQA